MKILALDLGDRWVGTALSDGLGISCKPYETVELEALSEFLTRIITRENIKAVVVGYPKTFTGGQSAQTEKIVALKEALEQQFCSVTWILWDERLSSKRAQEIQQKSFTPEAKKKSHSIAAAFILQSYLDNLAFSKVEL